VSETSRPLHDRPLRRDAQRNRERILAAARELFAERGVEATLDEVAARAGVGVGTVYRRYPNKDALLDELFEEAVSDLVGFAAAALAEPDAWTALVGFLERLEERFAANRALEQLVLAPRPARRHQQVASARERLRPPTAALVDRAKAEGKLRADFDAADIGMIHRMLAAVVNETRDDAPDLWRRYFTMIVDGLAANRSRPTEIAIAPPPQPRTDS
jgi:AcrR family transcriptional regulator